MKKPKFLNKFTLVDYIIIIVVIATIIFAFIHINSDDQNQTESTSFDSSTLNKVVEKYLDYYKEGKIVKTTVSGLNSTNNEQVTVNGEIVWIDDDRGSNVKVLVKSGNETYLCGLYKDIPEADIYLEKLSLEVDGSMYKNLTEFSIKPSNITSIGNLTFKLSNYSNYEVSSSITVNELDSMAFQQLTNTLFENGRISFKLSSVGLSQKISIVRATPSEISTADNIIGNIDGVSDEITIRVYNCTLDEKEFIEQNFDVLNVKTY